MIASHRLTRLVALHCLFLDDSPTGMESAQVRDNQKKYHQKQKVRIGRCSLARSLSHVRDFFLAHPR